MDFVIIRYQELQPHVIDEIIEWEGLRAVIAGACIEMGLPGEDLLLGYDNGELVSIALLTLDHKGPAGLPAGDYVTVEYLATKRSGYGRDTMKRIIEWARSQTFSVVLTALASAMGFYQAIGMNRVGTSHNFFV